MSTKSLKKKTLNVTEREGLNELLTAALKNAQRLNLNGSAKEIERAIRVLGAEPMDELGLDEAETDDDPDGYGELRRLRRYLN